MKGRFSIAHHWNVHQASDLTDHGAGNTRQDHAVIAFLLCLEGRCNPLQSMQLKKVLVFQIGTRVL